ncbi:MAG: energy transducer TonB family protein [Bacteroidales bacterium]
MEKKNERVVAGIATLLIHLLILLILFYCGLSRYIPQEEEGIEVIFGNQIEASGEVKYTEELSVETPPQENVSPPEPVIEQPAEEEIVSQPDEESIALAEKKKKETEKQKQELEKLKREEYAKQEQERKLREAEERRIAEEKSKAEAISKRTSGAFAKATDSSQGDSKGGASGIEGSQDGNSKTGVTQGIGGNGDSWTLDGRRIRGKLPRPEDRSNYEGQIVVNITVDPSGKVIQASINASKSRGAAASVETLRQKAVNAAKTATFDDANSTTNARGEIKYQFKTY